MKDDDALRRARADRQERRRGRATAAVMIGAVLASAGLVSTAEAAHAVPLAPVALQARMVDHIGYSGGAPAPSAGDCARYGTAPSTTTAGAIGNAGGSPGTAAAALTDGRTAWVSAGTTAYSAHGSSTGRCGGPDLDLSRQSAMGFEPAALGSIETGTIFNLGRMVHLNNPLLTLANPWQRGSMQIDLLGAQLSYEWELHETSNTATPVENPINDDVVEFLNTVADSSFAGPDGNRYTLVVLGFTAPQEGTACAATLADPGTVLDRFETVERAATYGCLYAEVRQVRPLTITKIAEAAAVPDSGIPAFAFSATGAAGSPWATGFSLTPAGLGAQAAASVTNDIVVGSPLTISEQAGAAPWGFTGLACVDGLGDPIPESVSGATVTLAGDLSVTDPARAPIECTFTNTAAPPAEPVGRLTLAKTVTPRDGTPAEGYTGGDGRTFTVEYSCARDGVPAASGTVVVSIATPAVVEGIPAASVCRIVDERDESRDGDFADAAYSWDGFDVSSASVVVDAGANATLTIDNRFERQAVTASPTASPTSTPTPIATTAVPSPSATPPGQLPLTDGGGPTSLPLTGAGPVAPFVVLGAGLLIAGALASVLALRARRHRA